MILEISTSSETYLNFTENFYKTEYKLQMFIAFAK